MKARSIALCLLCTAISYANAQVRLVLPKDHFKQHEQIDVRITNDSNESVTFCVQVGHWSIGGLNGAMEATPTPVIVQTRYRGKWSTLLIGPDIGYKLAAVQLEAGKTQHYPFRLSDRGRMRLVLEYWKGERAIECENTKPTDKRKTKSKDFLVE